MLISRRAVNEFLDRDFEEFTWMKKLAREQIMRELNALKVKPYFKTEPWLHQLVCFYIGLMYPRFMFLLDMGLGKSKILADLITQTQRERKLEGALITVPRLINIDSWTDDLAVHSDLEPWPINCETIEEKWERLIKPKGDVTIVDYQGLALACTTKKKNNKGKLELFWDAKKLKMLMKQYNWVGFDEIHKLKNHNSLWFSIANQVSKRAEFAYGSTGTLFGKEVEAIWSQFYLVDRGETFGENLGPFRAAFFTAKMNPWKGQVLTFNKSMDGTLHSMLQHRSIRYDEDEVHDLPARVMRTLNCDMGEEQREHYMRALEGLINAGGKVSELEAQWLRMRQIVSGYLAWKDGSGDHVIRFKHNPKLDHLESIIDAMGDTKIVVAYDYTETGRMIVDRIKEMGLDYEWYYGGTKDQSASRRRFMDDPKCKVFVMNSEAGGTGNDGLQKVARYLVFYETPPEPISRKQTMKRVHRPGQTRRTFIYDLVMRRSLDKGILEDIAAGNDTYSAVVGGKRKNRGFFLS